MQEEEQDLASTIADLELELHDAIKAIEEKNTTLRRVATFIEENDLPGGDWHAADCRSKADLGPNVGGEQEGDNSAWLQFWEAYPRKIGKPAAEKKFRTQKCAPIIHIVLSALEQQKQSKQWQTMEYIPHPATWLNQRRWEAKEEKPEQPNNGMSYDKFI